VTPSRASDIEPDQCRSDAAPESHERASLDRSKSRKLDRVLWDAGGRLDRDHRLFQGPQLGRRAAFLIARHNHLRGGNRIVAHGTLLVSECSQYCLRLLGDENEQHACVRGDDYDDR
jgi:hypothetical protein